MKISFVIPAYNEEATLGAALEAIHAELRRTPAEAEIIVVDNASTDGTPRIAASFPGIRLIRQDKKGVAHAREAGFRAGTGELIASIDADTEMPEGWLRYVFKRFDADPKLVALSGPFFYHDLPLFSRIFWRAVYFFGYIFGYLVYYRLLKKGAMIQGGNNVLRRSALERIGGYDTSLTFYGEDVDIARRIIEAGKVVWTFRLPMYSSGRRIAAEGAAAMAWKYAVNYCWSMLFGRPYHTTHTDIREEAAEKPS